MLTEYGVWSMYCVTVSYTCSYLMLRRRQPRNIHKRKVTKVTKVTNKVSVCIYKSLFQAGVCLPLFLLVFI